MRNLLRLAMATSLTLGVIALEGCATAPAVDGWAPFGIHRDQLLALRAQRLACRHAFIAEIHRRQRSLIRGLIGAVDQRVAHRCGRGCGHYGGSQTCGCERPAGNARHHRLLRISVCIGRPILSRGHGRGQWIYRGSRRTAVLTVEKIPIAACAKCEKRSVGVHRTALRDDNPPVRGSSMPKPADGLHFDRMRSWEQ